MSALYLLIFILVLLCYSLITYLFAFVDFNFGLLILKALRIYVYIGITSLCL